MALSANEARFFRFRVFFGVCSLLNEVADPQFFCLFGNNISLPFCVASLKNICAWELLGANVLRVAHSLQWLNSEYFYTRIFSVVYSTITKKMNLINILINTVETFDMSKEEQNTHVLDTTASRVKWRPQPGDDGRQRSREFLYACRLCKFAFGSGPSSSPAGFINLVATNTIDNGKGVWRVRLPRNHCSIRCSR